MPAGGMHADEVPIDVSLVGRLLAAQFPNWADLPIEPVESAGTDNASFAIQWTACPSELTAQGPVVVGSDAAQCRSKRVALSFRPTRMAAPMRSSTLSA